MKSGDYQKILACNVGPRVRKLGLRQRSWVFQQVNDPNHTSQSTQKRSETKCWRILKWPAMSPDLNPIERPWKGLKIAVARGHPSNLRNLEQFAKEELSKIPVRGVGNLLMVIGSDWFQLFSPKGVQPNINLRLPMILFDPVLYVSFI